MNKKELMDYWINGSEEDFVSMEHMFSTKMYSWSLFVGHLMIEKLMKALFVKANGETTPVPRIHNLVTLAERANVKISREQEKALLTFNSFQLNARYADYKLNFYKRCTKSYTTQMIKEIREMRLWLKNQI